MKKIKTIPKRLQPILWSCNIKQLDLERDKAYIIHQILIYGTLDDFKWLFKAYSKKEIIDVFLNASYKSYPNFIFYFVKNYLLGLKNIKLNENNYVTSISGFVRPRAAEGVFET